MTDETATTRTHDDLPFELSFISLDHLEVDRLGFLDEPGRFHWDTRYGVTDHGEVVLCLIVNEVSLLPIKAPGEEGVSYDEDSERPKGDSPAANISMAHMVVFTNETSVRLTASHREEMVAIARMSVQPLLRSMVLTSCAEMGFPPLTLPLLRRSELPPATELTLVEDELQGSDP